MRIITLGTGSGKPTLRRNVSAMAVAWDGQWILFDCGEGSQIQVMKSGLHPSRLSAIFITHLHGDHFNGLAGFLSTMGLDRRESPLVVVGPPGINDYIELLGRLKTLYVSYPLEVRELGLSEFQKPRQRGPAGDRGPAPTLESPLIVYESEKFVVKALPLEHRIFDIGYRVEEPAKPGRFDVDRAHQLGIPVGPLFGRLQSGSEVRLADGTVIRPSDVLGPERPGNKIAYCTDTRPCQSSRVLAQEVDLLVHEATFADDLADEAVAYGHSTAAQAAAIAKESRARRLLITHISARYADSRRLLEEARQVFPETVLAEDLMELEVQAL
jgi:ribonuclease Z